MRYQLVTLVLLLSVLLAASQPCENPINRGALFCNVNATLEARLKDLLSRIPLNETAGLFSNTAGGVPSLAIPPYQWWSEGLHGVAFSPGVQFNATSGFPAATSFPQVSLTASSFNTTLFRLIGATIGMEARAMNNYGAAGLTYWAPNINIYRDPRWGRGQETPGEDPYLTSQYVIHFVQGMQSSALDPNRLQVSACCKHFLGYDMENSDGYTRHNFDAHLTEYDLNHTYLVAFQSCVHPQGGAATGMMCSYNAENGIPSCANRHFITEIARETWKFSGYVTSDCGAIGDIQNSHHYTHDPLQTLNVTFSAGVDLDCGSLISRSVLDAVNSGYVAEASVFDALGHQFEVLFRLGYFDPAGDQPLKSLGPDNVSTPDAQQLALEAAEQGIVLLNYNVSYLPWGQDTQRSVRSVAVMGNNANNSRALQGNYFGTAPYLITPLDGIQKVLNQQFGGGEVRYLEVLSSPTDMNTTHYDAACRLAQTSDETVLVIGLDQSQEGEGLDRTSIDFPGNQNFFVHTVANCAHIVGKQITVVAFSGGSLDYSHIHAERGVGGLLWAGYPGQAGGLALANILFGVVSPSGKLTTTIYPASFVNDVEMSNMQMIANRTTGSPGYTYKYYTQTPVYPFSWGLTYTNWTLIPLDVSRLPTSLEAMRSALRDAKNAGALLTRISLGSYEVNITNTGRRSSAFTVLSKTTPLPPGPDFGGSITDFVRVFLNPGEWTVVTLHVNAQSFMEQLHPVERTSYQLHANDIHIGTFQLS